MYCRNIKHYFFPLVLTAWVGVSVAAVPDSLLHKQYKSNMHYLPEFNIPAGDSVDMFIYGETRRFDSEVFFEHYATRPLHQVYDELYYYYFDYLAYSTMEQKDKEVVKMRQAARKYKSKALEHESEYLELFLIAANKNQTKENIKGFQSATDRAARRGDLPMKIRLKFQIFMFSYSYEDRYYFAFQAAEELLEDMEKVTKMELPMKGEIYFEIGNLYYKFHDYEKAIPILEKALTTTPSPYFFDRFNLRARNTLGAYYRMTGDLERSDEYFLSMLQSPDMVKFRPMYDAIAIKNLGNNCQIRGQYDEAIKLYKIALPVSLSENDYSFAAGITEELGQCYLVKGELNKAKAMIDSSIVYLADPHAYRNPYAYRTLYRLMSKYHLKIGEIQLAEAEIDSVLALNARYENSFSRIKVMTVEQQLLEEATTAKNDKLRLQQNQLTVSIVFVAIILLALLVIIYYYLKTRRSLEALALKAQQWARTEPVPDEYEHKQNNGLPDIANSEDVALMKRISELMEIQQIFKSSDLSLDSLAGQLDVSRYHVSQAINRCANKNFNTLVNEYRIREAIKILSDVDSAKLSMDGVAFESGFNDRSTFSRIFKKSTGLTPSEFKNNSKNR